MEILSTVICREEEPAFFLVYTLNKQKVLGEKNRKRDESHGFFNSYKVFEFWNLSFGFKPARWPPFKYNIYCI